VSSISPEQIRQALLSVFVLIVSVALHEFGHAFMADRLGDDTPRRQGRVTLNPIAHADPIGTLLLPLVGGLYGVGFGWGKPVQWQPSRINRKWKMATAQILVAIAGPMMNVVLALVTAIVHTILVWRGVISRGGEASHLIAMAVETNFLLFFFNLIPAPPLDGGHVAQGFTPYRHREKWDQIARFGPIIIIAVVAIPALARIFLVPADWCTDHVYKILFGLVGLPT
jgi:Zn-dependent protease